jgi:hypothetical protein
MGKGLFAVLQEFPSRDPVWFVYEIVEDIPMHIRGGFQELEGIYDIPLLPGYQDIPGITEGYAM